MTVEQRQPAARAEDTHEHQSADTGNDVIGAPSDSVGNTTSAIAGIDRVPVPQPDLDGDRRETGEPPQSPPMAMELIAHAYDLHGLTPRLVIDFNHPSGKRVRRLLPESAFESGRRARKALTDAGVPGAVARASAGDLMIAQPAAIGMYEVPNGWSLACDAGFVYRFGDTTFTSSGPIPVYADGPVPDPTQDGDLGALKEMLAADVSPENVLLFAVHYLCPLIQLFDRSPLVIVVSGMPNAVADRLSPLAESAFGTAPATTSARASGHDGSLARLKRVNSRKEAFLLAQNLIGTTARRGARGKESASAPAAVTVLMTSEAESPRNLTSPPPPASCIEIPYDTWAKAVAERSALSVNAAVPTGEPSISSEPGQPDAPGGVCAQDFGAVAAKSYIEAIVRKRDEVVSHSDENIRKLVDRYLGLMTIQREDAVVCTATTFALMRFALMCGRQFKVLPWDPNVCHVVMDGCVKCWSERHRARESEFERRVLDAVKRLAVTGKSDQTRNAPDREVRHYTVGARELILIEPPTFDALIVAGRDKSRVIDVLRKRKLLVSNGDGAQYQKRVGDGRARFYAIEASVLRIL